MNEFNITTKQTIEYYIQLCKSFCVSDIWKDTKAIIKYHVDNKADELESPMLMLYEPVFKLTKLGEELSTGKLSFDESVLKQVKQKADEIWYAVEQRSDVRDLTSDDEVEIDPEIVGSLVVLLELSKPSMVNKSFLRDISGEIWDLLGGDI